MTALDSKRNIMANEINNLFSDIYRDYSDLIVNSINVSINRIDIAENIAHEVFIKFLLELDKTTFFNDMKTSYKRARKWLFKAMQNDLLHYYRDERNMPEETAIAEVYENAALIFINGMRDTRIIIEEAIETLEDERELLIFQYVAVENRSYKETGQILGLSKKQIRTRYGVVTGKILNYLKEKRGIENLGDLL